MNEHDTPPLGEPPALDWTNRDDLRKWFAAMNVIVDDLSAVVEDMLLPLRQRRLGPVQARALYQQADSSLRLMLDGAERGLVNGSRAKRDEDKP